MSVYFTAGPDCEIVVWSSETGPSVERQILRNVQPGSAGYTIKPLPRLHCLCTTIFIGFRTAGRVKTLPNHSVRWCCPGSSSLPAVLPSIRRQMGRELESKIRRVSTQWRGPGPELQPGRAPIGSHSDSDCPLIGPDRTQSPCHTDCFPRHVSLPFPGSGSLQCHSWHSQIFSYFYLKINPIYLTFWACKTPKLTLKIRLQPL